MLRIEFEQNLAANEQTGPINKEMRNLITTLQNHNRQLKVDLILTYVGVLGFPEPKWNLTFVLILKGRPLTRRGHPPQKDGPPSSQGWSIPTKKEEICQLPELRI